MTGDEQVNKKFNGVFCDVCKKKSADFFMTHRSWVVFKPQKLQQEMAKLICKKCRKKALGKMRG